MSRIVYVNGRYLPYAKAGVHVEDRGFQFGDAVYEVCQIDRGRLVDAPRHIARLRRSMSEIEMQLGMPDAALMRVITETIRRNRVADGLVYLQVSRGAGPRDFVFPASGLKPTVVCIARATSAPKQEAAYAVGIKVVTLPDARWARPDIKTVQLLPAALAKVEAKRQGAKEAWLVDRDGKITEGASSNAWIVDSEGTLITRKADSAILRGVTRTTLLDVVEAQGTKFVERAFSVKEAHSAKEAFVTSANNIVMPVVQIDDTVIGDGKPGPLSKSLRGLFSAAAHFG